MISSFLCGSLLRSTPGTLKTPGIVGVPLHATNYFSRCGVQLQLGTAKTKKAEKRGNTGSPCLDKPVLGRGGGTWSSNVSNVFVGQRNGGGGYKTLGPNPIENVVGSFVQDNMGGKVLVLL